MPIISQMGLDSDLEWNAAKRFRFEVRHIAALFQRYLPIVKHNNVWKFLIICCSQPPINRPPIIGGVVEAHIYADATNFDAMSESGKESFALDALTKGIEVACLIACVDPLPYREALKIVAETNFVNQWVFPLKPISSPDRGKIAQIECYHGAKSFSGTLVVRERNGAELLKLAVIETEPMDNFFVPLLKTLKWDSNDSIFLAGMVYQIYPRGIQ